MKTVKVGRGHRRLNEMQARWAKWNVQIPQLRRAKILGCHREVIRRIDEQITYREILS